MSEEQDDNTVTQLTRAQNDFNSLQVRLNTDAIIERFELLLRGVKCEWDMSGTEPKVINKLVGLPVANERGIQVIMRWVSGIYNPQNVQGNFLVEKKGFSRSYDDFMCWFREDFGEDINTNLYEYDIDETLLMSLVDQIESQIRPFMTRLIANKERESFSGTIKESGRTVVKDKSGFQFFKER